MLLAAAVVATLVHTVAADLPGGDSPAPSAVEVGGAPTPDASPTLSPKGFAFGRPEEFQLRLRGVLDADGRGFPVATPALPSTFLIRRARLYIEGTIVDFIDFRLLPDFGQGKLQLLDAYVDVHAAPELALRIGKMKSPFGLERLQAEQNLVFLERGLPSNLTPDRDIGVSLHGAFGAAVLLYEVGLFDGAPDGASVDGDQDNDKDFVARLFGHPFRPLGVPGLDNFGLGVGFTYGREAGAAAAPLLPTYVLDSQQPFFSYSATTAATTLAAGEHLRISPQAYEYWGPVGLLGEYVYGSQAVKQGAANGIVTAEAFQIAGSLALTGEKASYEGLEPRRPVDFRTQWGALELTARYGWLHVGDAAFPQFANAAAAARLARNWTVGATWYLRRQLKLLANFERATFLGGAQGAENAVLVRVQVAY